MKLINIKAKKLISVTLLLIFSMSSILMLFPVNSIHSENYKEDTEIDKGSDIKSTLKNAVIGNDEWWNATFFYRRLINITNPKSKDLIDFIVSVEFNCTELINENKMNSSLKDVRIVENGVLREYFVQIDYPSVDLATIWFETNCSSGSSELDTYIYYGNNEVEHDPNYYNKDNRFGLAWYRFDEGTGSSAYDSMGNYGAGSLVNMEGADWEDGRVGSKSLKFDGSNEYVTLPSINPTNAITVSAWIKSSYSTYYSGYWQMVSKYSAYILGTYGQNRRMAFLVYTNTWQYTSEFYVPSGDCDEWHLFIGTYDSSLANKSIFYDGEFMDDQIISGSINADTGPVTVAKREYNDVFFNGWIDDVRFYDYALSPDEIDGLYNYSSVAAIIQEEQPQSSDVTITAYDIDGRIVPNAIVYLRNYTTGAILDYKTTALNGSVIFQDLNLAAYNFTVNYTLSASGREMVVYNSSVNNDIFNFTGLTHSEDLTLNLWTIEFDIVDWDDDPLKYAYINISEAPGGDILETLRLNDGKTTFRWKNNSQYYYKIYYDNEDYNTIPVKLNESYIIRDNYEQNEKIYVKQINVNQTNILTGTEYQVQQDIYTNGSSQVGNKKLLKANITLNKMTDFLDTVKIYYLDRNGQFDEGSLIYFNDSYSGGQNDFIEINIRNTPEVSSNLINDNFEAYGLRIDLRGFNNTRSNGTLLVETVESCNIYNKTSMAKLQIRVLDEKFAIVPVQSCIVKVLNSTGDAITNLITDIDGYAHGQINSESEFWYLRNQPAENYTFILSFYGLNKLFRVNVSDKWFPLKSWVPQYNYSLSQNSSLVFKLQIDISEYQSLFADLIGDSAVTWGEIMTFSVNYTIKAGSGADWEGINNPDEIICTIGGIRFYDMNNGIGDGNFTIAIDSSEFSAGDSGEDYWVEIRGSKLGYIDPEPVYFQITINSIPTGMTLHNYATLNELSTNEISQYYNELINVTFRYYDANTDNPLIADTFTYEWDYGSGSVNLDPINPDYYTIEIDTSTAPNVGKYRIEIIAGLENYTKIDDIDFYINILSRPTSMNGSTGILYVSQDIYIFETMNFSFNYLDTMESAPITDADEISYLLQKLDENGDPISGTEETGSLREVNSLYVLDLETESRNDGEYSIIVTLNELNYDHRIAIISLTIMKRVFQIAWDYIFVDSKIEMDSGAALGFTVTLNDPNNDSTPVIGATVYMTFKGTDYDFTDNEDGTYTVNVPKIADAFFAPETFTATITIEKEYFSRSTTGITIVVNMAELFGFPTFYFLMIVGSIIAVVGSLTTYRVVQQRRIPTFVKKARSMKKNIKGNNEISSSLLYPSKEQFIVKKFGDKWEKLGLSLEEILGIKGKLKKEKVSIDKVKKEKLPEDKIKKVKADEKNAEKEKLRKEKLEKKKLEKETKEQERLEKEKLKQEKMGQEKPEEDEVPKERGEEE